jgi:hypothetical protein
MVLEVPPEVAIVCAPPTPNVAAQTGNEPQHPPLVP